MKNYNIPDEIEEHVESMKKTPMKCSTALSSLIYYPVDDHDVHMLARSVDHQEMPVKQSMAYLQFSRMVPHSVRNYFTFYDRFNMLELDLLVHEDAYDYQVQKNLTKKWLSTYKSDAVYALVVKEVIKFEGNPKVFPPGFNREQLASFLMIEKAIYSCVAMGCATAASILLNHMMDTDGCWINYLVHPQFLTMVALCNDYGLLDSIHSNISFIGFDRNILNYLVEHDCINTYRWTLNLLHRRSGYMVDYSKPIGSRLVSSVRLNTPPSVVDHSAVLPYLFFAHSLAGCPRFTCSDLSNNLNNMFLDFVRIC